MNIRLKRAIGAIFAMLVINLYFFYHTVFGSNGFYEYKQLQETVKKEQMTYDVNQLKLKKYEYLYNNIHAMRGNEEVEQFVKENYYYSRAGERVIVINSGKD